MSADITEVLSAYGVTAKGIRLLSWKGKKGAWEIQTSQGTLVLKKSPASRERQIFLNRAVAHLRNSGAPIPRLLRTRDGGDFAEYRGDCYTLSEAVAGRSPEYGAAAELRTILQTLGRFHAASRGFAGSGDGQERAHLGRWAEGCERHIGDMESFLREARRRSDAFSKLYAKHADTFLAQGREALAMLGSGSYARWVDKIRRIGCLCHQDFASGNLILNAKGLHVIDMDSLTVDLPARDLRKIFNKVMKKKGWDAAQTETMMRAYQSAYPLSADEWNVVKADLLFPHLFHGIGSKYYRGRTESGWQSGKTIGKLENMIAAERSKMAVLNGWDRLVRRVAGGGEEG